MINVTLTIRTKNKNTFSFEKNIYVNKYEKNSMQIKIILKFRDSFMRSCYTPAMYTRTESP